MQLIFRHFTLLQPRPLQNRM